MNEVKELILFGVYSLSLIFQSPPLIPPQGGKLDLTSSLEGG